MKNYDHKIIEKKWQEEWEKNKLYKVDDTVKGKENFYQLVEFTYPSGNLHVGHWYAFSVPDIFARYKRMSGYNVLYPMGFDAFGLPAENAAIKLGADPKIWTYEHMDKMRLQLRSMGASFDWDREVVTCDPKYYKWTQWMFNQFLKNDLAYRDVTKVNWCPKDMTILANEQVVDGKCERCGAEVEQRDQEQWMLRISKYADRLIDDLDTLDWPHEIKSAQKNWIGRSEGSEIEFGIKNVEEKIKVFTTRADTLFGVTYVVLAPEHELISKLKDKIENWNEVEKYISDTKKKSELDRQQSKEKTGVELKGIKAINPANNEEVPVWIADYVLAGYGTGAVMAVPAHDERDFEFAKKYNLPIKEVIAEIVGDRNKDAIERNRVCAIIENNGKVLCDETNENQTKFGGNYVLVGGGIEEGETPEDALIREVREEVGLNIDITKFKKIQTLRSSWYSERRKCFRTMLHHAYVVNIDITQIKENTKEAKLIWVDIHEAIKNFKKVDNLCQAKILEKYLASKDLFYDGNGELINSSKFNGLASEEARKKITEFVGGKLVNTYRLRDWGISRQRYWGVPIPIVYDIEGKAHPVPDEHLPWLLPTDVDYKPDGTAPLARSKELLERTEKIFGKGWKPEVETMDTFVDSSWYFYRYLDNNNDTEFADKEKINSWMPVDLYMGGAEHTTMHLLYSRFWVKALFDLGLVKDSEAYTMRRNRGLILGPDGNKMSKSKGNVIDPDEIVERLGADTVRLYLAFMGPYGVTVNYPWDPNGVVGVRRFLERVWKLQEKIDKNFTEQSNLLHKTIKGIDQDIKEHKYNTCISKMMILLNGLDKQEKISEEIYKTLLQLLAPFAPHTTEELWADLGEKESIHLSLWPKYDEALTKDDEITIALQVNSKVRAEILINIEETEEEIKQKALKNEAILKHLEGKEIKRVVYVKNKLLNIIV
ncbi:class I tRNA ligase family protein [Candidatus Nomurabacteria bacterium]|nr:class I tRNA ligase family protein [Candidatus Nomurabacteria bacterium]